jgi:hypothetical protein
MTKLEQLFYNCHAEESRCVPCIQFVKDNGIFLTHHKDSLSVDQLACQYIHESFTHATKEDFGEINPDGIFLAVAQLPYEIFDWDTFQKARNFIVWQAITTGNLSLMKYLPTEMTPNITLDALNDQITQANAFLGINIPPKIKAVMKNGVFKAKTWTDAREIVMGHGGKQNGKYEYEKRSFPVEIEKHGSYTTVRDVLAADLRLAKESNDTFIVQTYEMAKKLAVMDGSNDGRYDGRLIEIAEQGLYRDIRWYNETT